MPMPMNAASLIGVSTTPLVAISFPQATRHFVGAIVLGDFLANEDDIGIALDFFGKRLVEGFAVFDEGHNLKSEDCSMQWTSGRRHA